MTEVLGSMRRIDDTRGAVRVEDVYDTDIDDLWSAVTDPVRLARWMATVEGDLKPGGTWHGRFTSSWEGSGRVDVCDAPHRLLVTLEPGTSDETVVEAYLSAEGERTRLVIEERGLPLDVLYQHGAGWQAHIEDLSRFLAGGESTWRARWAELSPTYQGVPIAPRRRSRRDSGERVGTARTR